MAAYFFGSFCEILVHKNTYFFTHFIKLSLTVDFIFVNKCKHNPVTDNTALKENKNINSGSSCNLHICVHFQDKKYA